MTDAQTVINVLLGLVAFLGAWVINSIKDSLKSLTRSDAEIASKVQAIELLVAGTYVKRGDLEQLSHALFAKLDKIEEKLDSKADKSMCGQIRACQ